MTNMQDLGAERGKWLWISLVIAMVGAGLSIYATFHHFDLVNSGATDAFCNINEQFSCDDVARSPYSTFFGIPLGIWGLGFFLAQIVLVLSGIFRPQSSKESLHGLVGLTVIGAVASLALIFISTFLVGKFCLNCIGIYIVCFAQIGVLLAYRSVLPTGFTLKSLANGGVNAALVVALVVVGFNFTKDWWMKPPSAAGQNSTAGSQLGQSSLALAPNALDIKIDKSAFSGMGEDFRKGNDDARVTIVEFADFQCPACRSAWELLKQVQQQYGDQVLIVFKNYPLDKSCNSAIQGQIHEYACEAAVLARCAGMQGKFWQMADKLFSSQSSMNSETMMAWALAIGLSPEQVAECKKSKDIVAKIQDDIKQGNQLNVNATPTIFINGRQIIGGRSMETIQAEIERILGS
jgi:protein-disulfide isomerase